MSRALGFPPIEWWRRHVLWEHDQARFFKGCYYDYYLTKYLLATAFRPQRICEIGVRVGYSAYSFLRASPAASYVGFDNGGSSNGGIRDADGLSIAERMLAGHFPDASIKIHLLDTRSIEEIPGGPFDFAHIDGDHHEGPAYHDMELMFSALDPGGIVLVDDYTKIDGVRRAADRFVKHHAAQIERTFLVGSLTGEFVIVKEGVR